MCAVWSMKKRFIQIKCQHWYISFESLHSYFVSPLLDSKHSSDLGGNNLVCKTNL